MMMRLNGGLNLEKLKWLRKIKSKKNGRSQFMTAKFDFTTQTIGCKDFTLS